MAFNSLIKGLKHTLGAKLSGPSHRRTDEHQSSRIRLQLEYLEGRLAPAAGLTGSGLPPAYGHLPLSFEANAGQTDARVQYLAHGSGYALFLSSTGAVLNLEKAAAADPAARPANGTGVALAMNLVGANPGASVAGLDKLSGTSNYFIGNDPSQWHANIANYGQVAYHDVYPGVNLLYYGNQRQLEYDFVVDPGADPTRIRLGFQGADSIRLDDQGNLVLHTGSGDVLQHAPVVYQEVGGGRQAVAGQFVLLGQDQVRFQVGPYDASLPLTIDPVLSYSTYLGGNGNERGNGIAVDGAGNAYITGFTGSNFPTTAGAFQTTVGGSAHAFVAKLNAAGTALIYCTYLGGNGEDLAGSIAVDGSGNAYITGATRSSNFPTTAGAYQTSSGGGAVDAFVAKLNAAGTALVYGTYLGGNGGERGTDIVVDGAANVYVTGNTSSTNFPTTSGAYQASYGGSVDAFVTKVNAAGTALVYSTYLGGNSEDVGNGIAVDGAGNAYITGYTVSTNFPTTAGIYQTSWGGYSDAFMAKLNAAGSALSYSTYLGGNREDLGNGIALDGAGNAYVTGYASSTNFPTTTGAYQTSHASDFGTFDAFVAKLNSTGTALIYSTYLGGNHQDYGYGIALDGSGNAYITGSTYSANFPTTTDAFQANHSDGGGTSDAFIAKLNVGGTSLIYNTYLGGNSETGVLEGNSEDEALAIAVDASGNAYVTGYTYSSNFPTTTGAFQTSHANDAYVVSDTGEFANYGDVFVLKLYNPSPSAHIVSPTTASSNQVGLTLTATDPSSAAQQAGFIYTIDWGDGTAQNPDMETIAATANNGGGAPVSHTYASSAAYWIAVTATDMDDLVSPRATAVLVIGTGSADTITVAGGDNPGDVQINLNGSTQTFHPTELVALLGQGGGDTYTVNFGSTLTTPIYAVGGGNANDTLVVNGDTSPTNVINKTTGQVTWGSPIIETVHYTGIPNTTINANGTSQNYVNDPGSNTIINGGPGANTIIITATTGTGVVINGGGAANTYIVDLGSLGGPVTISNSHAGAANNVVVNAPAGNNTITASGNQVTEGAQSVQITTSSLTSLAIVGGPGADQIAVTNFSVPVQSLTVAGGAGSDQITIANPAAAMGSVNVDGGTGSDTVALNNLGTQVAAVTVAGGGDGDQVQVQGSLPPTVHLPPTVGAIAGPVPTAVGNTAVSASAMFSDLDGGSHTATWNWGDNATSGGTVTQQTSTAGSFTGSHTYAATGVYTLTLTVTDGQLSGQATFQYVVIYDPSAGFITGGGWITSPAGAYAANPALTGKANFGFESKYKKGANVPTGNTQFNFSMGNLDFHSTSYDWLVVAGAKAQYKGSGQINYAGNYAFMLTAIDGGLPGGHDQDKFRIKIWDKATNIIIYDNQMGASDTGDPSTVIGGGSIVIHSSNQLLNEAPLEGANLTPLTLEQLQPIEEQAVRLWVAAGADPASFKDVDVQIVDLPGSRLGLAAANTIWLDSDAAGHGWFIDSTPGDDSEFRAGSRTELIPFYAAAGKVDLLTVVAHELGHALGYEDNGTSGLMAEFLGTGVRRLPLLTQAGAKVVGVANLAGHDAGSHALSPKLAVNGAVFEALLHASIGGGNTQPTWADARVTTSINKQPTTSLLKGRGSNEKKPPQGLLPVVSESSTPKKGKLAMAVDHLFGAADQDWLM